MTTFNQSNNNTSNAILWSCIARNDTKLVEAGTDPYGGILVQAANELLCLAPTAGYEFHSIRQPLLRGNFFSKSKKNDDANKPPTLQGVKFHVFDELNENELRNHRPANNVPKDFKDFRIWTFAAVYDPARIHSHDVQVFLESLVELTILERESDKWKTCQVLGVHNDFARTLQQLMNEVKSRDPKIIKLEEQLQLCKNIMNRNINLAIQRGEKLEDLVEDSAKLESMTKIFKKNAKTLKRQQMWYNAKYGIIMGTAIVAGVGIPLLVVLL